ncbi:hypothetical protein SNEBB_004794 [Seison nebaliae]|nr:hypothetical protein SNEBB_004794 [Seison nebaliae]
MEENDKYQKVYKSLKESHHKAYETILKAIELDEDVNRREKNLVRIINLYQKGIDELNSSITRYPSTVCNEKGKKMRTKMTSLIHSSKLRLGDLKKKISVSKVKKIDTKQVINGKKNVKVDEKKNNMKNDEKKQNAEKLKKIDKELVSRILDEVLDNSCDVSFDDIAGLSNVKNAMKESILLPLVNPSLFSGIRSPARGILLFGPPGNGKSYVAKAIQTESKNDVNFFAVSASTLMSKYVGETEKLVKALFVAARELQPSIIFFDEIDSVLCERSDKDNEVSRRLKTEFLLQVDGIQAAGSDAVILIAATNRPFDLDEAMLRRFQRRFYVPLPDINGRETIIRNLLDKELRKNSLSSSDIHWIAMKTENFSASDLTELIKEAAMQPIRELSYDTLVKIDVNKLRMIGIRDFQNALSHTHPSINPDNLKRLETWAKQYSS